MTHPPRFIPCAVCDSVDPAPFLHPRRSPGPVVRCRTCGMVYVSPIESSGSLIDDTTALGFPEALRESTDLNLLVGTWEAALLTLGYVADAWLRRFAGTRVAEISLGALRRSRLDDRIVPLNLRDIVMIIAERGDALATEGSLET